ncbi:MAG TPA: hypothetical protein ENK70_07990 [Methylophaga sp.]|nr:hypothetical protein [Methylophaga sp.]
MAFSYTKSRPSGPAGGLRIAVGTWDADSVTSGNIVTGLSNILYSSCTNKVSETDIAKIDDTTTAGTMAISGVTSNDTGTWIAIGN